MKTITAWTVRIIKITAIGMVMVAANDEPASAKGLSEYLLKRYEKKLDDVLDHVDEAVRDWHARRRGQVSLRTPPAVFGRGPACGHLPNGEGPACCTDPGDRLLIEFSGGRDPYNQKARYRLICRK